ncbi:MAG: divalent-cation tolerance protein CutA [Gammaproteobacteria bacterium]|nr:MAG: divalent-cation tolerance protein CutA [Gammaproteobacteria bacterium]UTW43052.1 divalent-cation tolerance protein CutA [bacterium SCSIO 12844]
MDSQKYQMLLISIPKNQSTQMADLLVKSNLAACVSIMPTVKSIYLWQGQIHKDAESLLIIKSTSDKYAQLESLILKHHPYDVPEIIAFDITNGHKNYLNWISETLT